MKVLVSAMAGAIAASALMTLGAAPASALTAQECSAKYKAAKAGNTLGGKTWNDFRKTECGADDTAAAPKASATKPAAAKIAAGSAVFPAAVATKYASEKAYKQRLHTCADQYRANKASNANGGLKWIMKGGGYWSLCNKKLKGAKA